VNRRMRNLIRKNRPMLMTFLQRPVPATTM
jgi:hypothetical protein